MAHTGHFRRGPDLIFLDLFSDSPLVKGWAGEK
jgi:hypothetical protein